MIALLILRELLTENIRKGVMKAIALKVRARDARGVGFRGEVIDLSELGAVLRNGDGRGIADQTVLCGKGRGNKCRAHSEEHGANGNEFFHFDDVLLYIDIVGEVGAVGAACWVSAIFCAISFMAS